MNLQPLQYTPCTLYMCRPSRFYMYIYVHVPSKHCSSPYMYCTCNIVGSQCSLVEVFFLNHNKFTKILHKFGFTNCCKLLFNTSSLPLPTTTSLPTPHNYICMQTSLPPLHPPQTRYVHYVYFIISWQVPLIGKSNQSIYICSCTCTYIHVHVHVHVTRTPCHKACPNLVEWPKNVHS